MTTPADELTLAAEEHRLAMLLEERKWEMKKHELIYLEAGQHMRALNQLMWQAPTMAIAVTGGLWYGAATIDADAARFWVFAFTALVDFLTIVTLFRLRDRIENEIEIQSNFAGNPLPQNRKKYIVVVCWSIALSAAIAISIIGAANSDVFKKTPEKGEPSPVNTIYTQHSDSWLPEATRERDAVSQRKTNE